jgi:hypothetical protein
MPLPIVAAMNPGVRVLTVVACACFAWSCVRALSWSMLALLAVCLPAQTGSIDPTVAQLQRTPKWSPPQIELIEESAVDLRPWLPPVGEQSMNDCTTWAIAYAAKSYLEARDQGWLPDRPEHVFSPRFLYNQINGGKDDGSSFVKAIELMKQQGAATLATEPYRPRDFRTAPSDRARAEAAAFPVRDAHLIVDRTGIRRALQRRQIVVFGAHVNPIFLSGRFTDYTYTKDLFARDETLRQPGQPHGKHAMCIVGYDDRDHTFLVMNSWGRAWCRSGYVKVAYDLFDEIRLAGDNEGVFCNWAILMLDVEERVERGADGVVRPAAADDSTIAIRGYADAVRFEPELQKFAYTFYADLRGQRASLEELKQVDWFWKDELGKSRKATVSNAAGGFALVGGSVTNPVALGARLFFKDGREARLIEGGVQGPVPKADFRKAEVRCSDKYWGRANDGKRPIWYWEAKLDLPANEVFDVVEVRWQAKDKPLHVCKEGDPSPPGYSAALGWAVEAAPVAVEIVYRDGGRKSMTVPMAFADVVRDESVIEVESRVLGKDATGQVSRAWTLTVDVPGKDTLAVDHVEWELDPWLQQPVRSETQAFTSWAITGTSHRDFRAVAVIVRSDGTKQRLERWVELGEETRFPADAAVDLGASDEYLGAVDGKPVWRSTWKVVGDRALLARASDLVYRATDGDGKVVERKVKAADAARSYAFAMDVPGAQTVEFTMQVDGRSVQRSLAHTPSSPVNDAMHLTVLSSAEVDTTVNRQQGPDWYGRSFVASIAGPSADRQRMLSVEWRHRLVGRSERTLLDFGWTFWPSAFDLRSATDEKFTLEAVVTAIDGYIEYLTANVVPGLSSAKRPQLALRIREKFDGFDAVQHLPRWSTTIALVGDAEVVAAQSQWRVTAVEDGGAKVIDRELAKVGDVGTYWFQQPTNITAEVIAKDGTQTVLRGHVRAAAPRTEPLFLRLARRPSAEAGGVAFTLWLDGYDSVLEHVKIVRYQQQQSGFSQGNTRREGGAFVGFAIDYPVDGAFPVTAEVVLDSGETRTVTCTGMPAVPPSGFVVSDRYHGDGLWEVEARRVGPATELFSVSRDSWFGCEDCEGRTQLRVLPIYPWTMSRMLLPAGRHGITGVGKRLESPTGPVAQGDFEVGARPHGEELQLVVTKDHALNAPECQSPTWMVRIDGPERDLQQVRSVRYEVRDGVTRTVTRRYAEQLEGYACRVHAGRLVLRVEVTMQDGKKRQLSFEEKQ